MVNKSELYIKVRTEISSVCFALVLICLILLFYIFIVLF